MYLRVVSLGRGLRLRLFYLSASSSSGAGAGKCARSVLFANQFRSDVLIMMISMRVGTLWCLSRSLLQSLLRVC